MKLLVELFQENLFLAVEKGLEEALTSVLLVAILLLILKQLYMMVHIMMLTHLKWHLKLLLQWHLKAGMAKASPVLLEPIMKVEVETPEEYMGDVMGDLNSRRGRILGMEAKGAKPGYYMQKFRLEKCLVMQLNLRSMTKGRASYSMEFECYREVPKNVQEQLLS